MQRDSSEEERMRGSFIYIVHSSHVRRKKTIENLEKCFCANKNLSPDKISGRSKDVSRAISRRALFRRPCQVDKRLSLRVVCCTCMY